jgi:NIPSNAP
MSKKALVNLRIYTIRPRGIPEFLRIFEELGLPVQVRHLGPPVGYYISEIGPLNQVTHMWEYDSLADMEARRAARNADPDWAKYTAASAGFVTVQEDRIIRRVVFKSLG